MSAQGNNQIFESFQAGADLSAAKYHITRVASGNQVTLAGSANDIAALGVLQNEPQSGEAATVALVGLTPIVCGSSITAGALITISASGRAVTASPASGAGVLVVGRVLEASGADGDIVTAWISNPWRYYVSG